MATILQGIAIILLSGACIFLTLMWRRNTRYIADLDSRLTRLTLQVMRTEEASVVTVPISEETASDPERLAQAVADVIQTEMIRRDEEGR